MEITLEIGTPPQKIGLNLRSKIFYFSIASSWSQFTIYKINGSNTSSLIKLKYNIISEKEFYGYPIYESLIINKKEIKNVSLVLVTSMKYN